MFCSLSQNLSRKHLERGRKKWPIKVHQRPRKRKQMVSGMWSSNDARLMDCYWTVGEAHNCEGTGCRVGFFSSTNDDYKGLNTEV